MIKLNSIINLKDLAYKLGVELKLPISLNNNYLSTEITSVEVIDKANKEQVSISTSGYIKYLSTTQAAAVIIHPKYLDKCNTAALVTNNPRLALAKLLSLCEPPKTSSLFNNIHSSAVIGNNVKIGQNVVIEAGVIIADNCSIGDNTVIKANVVLYSNVRIGSNCLIHSNTVIGSDGFGFAQDEANRWVKMPHLGGVVIGDQVEIGSNTSVDRGCIGDTIINQGVIIDNLVQIAHNVVIGEYTAIAGCTGIAGSAVIGKRCLIGGASNIAGHLVIVDDVYISATSSVNKSLLKSGIYSSGLPVKDNLTWRKNIARFNMLDKNFKELLTRIKKLEQNTIKDQVL